VLIRSNMKSHGDADVARSIAYAKQIKVYPLSQASGHRNRLHRREGRPLRHHNPLRRQLLRPSRPHRTNGTMARPRPRHDRSIAHARHREGKTFAPDDAAKEALNAGIGEAHAWMEAKYDAAPPPFFEGTHWTFPGHPELIKAASDGYADPNTYPTDWRGLAYSYAYIGIKRMGAGQFYLLNIKDKDGEAYDGAKTYKLHVPANVPVGRWSLPPTTARRMR
jgi:hypothetical protein